MQKLSSIDQEIYKKLEIFKEEYNLDDTLQDLFKLYSEGGLHNFTRWLREKPFYIEPKH